MICPDYEACDEPDCPFTEHQWYCRFGSKIEPNEECVDTYMGCYHHKKKTYK